MTTSTNGPLGTTIETTTVRIGTLATMTAMTRHYENRLADRRSSGRKYFDRQLERRYSDRRLPDRGYSNRRSPDNRYFDSRSPDHHSVHKNERPATNEIQCFNSGEFGHFREFSKICPHDRPRDDHSPYRRNRSPFPVRDDRSKNRDQSPPRTGGTKVTRFNPARISNQILEYFIDFHVGCVTVRCLLYCGYANSSIQSRFYTKNFGNPKILKHTGEIAVAFNGATSPISGTFKTEAIFRSTPYPIAFKVIEWF